MLDANNPTTNTYASLGGVMPDQFRVDMVKLIGPQIKIDRRFQHEHWVVPIYLRVQDNNAVTVQVTFFPGLKTKRQQDGIYLPLLTYYD
jgi:hypothetical protein